MKCPHCKKQVNKMNEGRHKCRRRADRMKGQVISVMVVDKSKS